MDSEPEQQDDRPERWFRAFAEASPDAIVGSRGDGSIVVANARAEELFGYGLDELLGASILLLLPGLVLSALASPGPAGVRLDLDGRRRQGVLFPVRVSLTPIRSGSTALVAVLLQDISDQKKAERDRAELLASERAARSELERAGRMKDDFLATLSHELRTPLNAMLGWTQILRRTDLEKEIHARAVETIERNIRLQAQLIEDLLDMSRIISGKLVLNARATPLAPIIAAALETVSPAAQSKGIALNEDLDPDAGPVLGDAQRLQQVIGNLLTNAVKFTSKGGKVEVRMRQVGSSVQTDVHDTGQGIDAAILPLIFDRFRQADSSTTRSHGGLGLGLSIVRSLVEMHGGTVRAESPGPGCGATFIMKLPLARPAVHEAADAAAPAAANPVGPLAAPQPLALQSIKGVRVLIVDDEPDSREFVQRVLEDFDATVFTAASAAEALRALAEHRPQVILCDIGMPGEDGYQLIQKVRALPSEEGGRTPAAALTAYTRPEDRRKSLESGFQMHLSKPVDPRLLVEVVATLVSGTQPSF